MSVSWGDLQDARVGTLKALVDGKWEEVVPVGTPGPKGAAGLAGPVGPSGPDGLPGGPVPAGGEAGDIIRKDGAGDFEVEWDNTAHTGAVLQNGGLRGPWGGTGSALWTVTTEARRYLVLFNVCGLSATGGGGRWITLKMDGADIAYSRCYVHAINIHRAFHTVVATINPTAGSHTFTVVAGTNTGGDANDYGSVVLVPLPRG